MPEYIEVCLNFTACLSMVEDILANYKNEAFPNNISSINSIVWSTAY